MTRCRVLVEVSQGRLTIATIRGGAVGRSRSFPIHLTEGWKAALAGRTDELSSIVKELGVSGEDAIVLYWSPSAATGVFSCVKSAGRSQAVQAARLAISESAGFDLQNNPSALVPLANDRSAASGVDYVHTLGAADTEAATNAVVDLVSAAGLRVRQMLPLDAPAIMLSARTIRASSAAEGGRVVAGLWISDHGSILTGASRGRLKFLRQIAIGTDSLAAALAGEVRPKSGAAPFRLDAAAARELLHRCGIPARDQVIDPQRGLDGDTVLPLLQPVLQRWLVEIKQSLRFGFDEADRAAAVLVGMGAGSQVPRLLTIIAEQSGLSPGATVHAGCEGAIGCWLQERCPELNLLPMAIQRHTRQARLRRGIWVGVSAASLLIGADAMLSRADLQRRETENQALSLRLEAALPASVIRERLLGVQRGLAEAQQRLAAQMSPVVYWDAALASLAQETPESIRVQEIRFGVQNGVPTCSISGETPLDNSSENLKAYLDTLAGLPIVASCRLGSTSRGEAAFGPVQNFDMQLTFVGLPAQPLTLRTASVPAAGDGGQTP